MDAMMLRRFGVPVAALLLAACAASPETEQVEAVVVEEEPVVEAAAAAEVVAEATAPITVSGFMTPESVLHDEAADVYLVSNINGSPLAKDDNGFISRVSPTGEVLERRWIDGADADVMLSAPKGMAVRGDRLYVTDIDAVRVFDRNTGAPVASWPVAGATFMNDLAVGPNGTLYATDSGLQAGDGGFAPSGTDAVYRFDAAGNAVAVASGDQLQRPNGIMAGADMLVVVPFGGNQAYHIMLPGGEKHAFATLPAGSLDGVVQGPGGGLLVSSWEGSAVYRVADDGVVTAVSGVASPADIGYDARRERVLIPLFNENRVEIRTIE